MAGIFDFSLFNTPEFQDIIKDVFGSGATKEQMEKLLLDSLSSKKYTKEQIEKRLKDLFNRILDSSIDGAIDCEVCEDIKYIGQCEGILESTETLEIKHLKKLNKLWKKYKE